MSRLSNLRRDERGNGVVEIGLIFPVFMLMLGGLVETSRAYSIKLDVEQAAQRGIEWVQVSDFKYTDLPTIRADAAAAAGVPQSQVTTDAWLECGGVRQSNYDGTCTQGVTMQRFVTVQVQRTYTPWINTHYFRLPSANASGGYNLRSTAGVRVQ